MASLYRDYDALAYNPRKLGEERGAINHIKKVKQKAKGLEIVFDPRGHRDFVTGFRKRKQQRRKEAIQQLEAKSKKQRVEQRAERRTKLKQELGLPDNYGVGDSSSESEEDEEQQLGRADVKVFQQGQVTTTVSVVNLHPDSDEEAAGSSDDDDDDDDGSSGSKGDAGDDGDDEGANGRNRQRQQQQQNRQPQQHGQRSKHAKGSSSGGGGGGVVKHKRKSGKEKGKNAKGQGGKKGAGKGGAAKHKRRGG